MTPSLRSHIADVLHQWHPEQTIAWHQRQADALLADPTLAAIIDLAAKWERFESPEVRALLAAWRASQAEQEPER